MFGRLRVKGNKIVGDNNHPVQLKGMSLFWSQWSTPFYNRKTISYLASKLKCTIIRAAMGAQNGQGGYLDGNSNREQAIHQVVTVVDAAIREDIYVIIDWHAHDVIQHRNQARHFFVSMAKKYKNTSNVIFEIYNEPINEQWHEVKVYAESVIGAIRDTGAKNLIVVGTPFYCQHVDIASENPITAFHNVAYSLHFYAGTHRDSERSRAQKALDNGIALFVTEWGTCQADGNGNLDLNETAKWFRFMDENKLSWCNWSLNDKPESASVLKSDIIHSRPAGPWTLNELTESGKFVFNKISNRSRSGRGRSSSRHKSRGRSSSHRKSRGRSSSKRNVRGRSNSRHKSRGRSSSKRKSRGKSSSSRHN